MLIPTNNKVEITAPKIKYFKPASVENSEFLLKVANKKKVKL
jgi:hypothetical protein